MTDQVPTFVLQQPVKCDGCRTHWHMEETFFYTGEWPCHASLRLTRNPPPAPPPITGRSRSTDSTYFVARPATRGLPLLSCFTASPLHPINTATSFRRSPINFMSSPWIIRGSVTATCRTR